VIGKIFFVGLFHSQLQSGLSRRFPVSPCVSLRPWCFVVG